MVAGGYLHSPSVLMDITANGTVVPPRLRLRLTTVWSVACYLKHSTGTVRSVSRPPGCLETLHQTVWSVTRPPGCPRTHSIEGVRRGSSL